MSCQAFLKDQSLFINDMPQGIDSGSDLGLYADDTKLWRKITCDEDLRCC